MQQVGKYQLVRKLAMGGMAEVHLAKSAGPMGFEKTLVVKRILAHLAEDEQFVEMFLSEAKLAAQLNHPNVVQIFDFGTSDGTHYLAMEYIDGPNLRTVLKQSFARKQPIPFGVSAKIISFACEGLAYAHDFADPETGEPLHLIHRDISPDNILLSRSGGVKVVDFGIAKAANQSHHTKTGLLKGKLSYMPPEQLQGKPLDLRADLFALGMVLYELVTGQKPFDASSEVAIMQAILNQPLIPAVSRRADVPEGLQRILEKALAKDREQRYAHCRELQVDLERFILSTGEPVGPYQLAKLVAEIQPADAAPKTPRPQTPPAEVVRTAMMAPSRGDSAPAEVVGTEMIAAATVAQPPPAPAEAVRTVMSAAPAVTELRAPPTAVGPPPAEPPRRSGARGLLTAALVLVAAGGGAGAVWLLGKKGSSTVVPPLAATAPAPTAPRPAPEPAPELARAVEPPKPAAPAVAEVSPAPEPEPAPASAEAKPIPAKATRPARAKPVAARPVVASAPAVRAGKVEFRVRPYATVFVDGKNLGTTPFAPVELPEGSHAVRLVNAELNQTHTSTFEVKGGQSQVFKHVFSE